MSPAAELLLERAATLDEGAVPSPCISVCRMSAGSGLCEGCFRSLEEIAAWGMQGDEERRAVWRLLVERAAAEAA